MVVVSSVVVGAQGTLLVIGEKKSGENKYTVKKSGFILRRTIKIHCIQYCMRITQVNVHFLDFYAPKIFVENIIIISCTDDNYCLYDIFIHCSFVLCGAFFSRYVLPPSVLQLKDESQMFAFSYSVSAWHNKRPQISFLKGTIIKYNGP